MQSFADGFKEGQGKLDMILRAGKLMRDAQKESDRGVQRIREIAFDQIMKEIAAANLEQ